MLGFLRFRRPVAIISVGAACDELESESVSRNFCTMYGFPWNVTSTHTKGRGCGGGTDAELEVSLELLEKLQGRNCGAFPPSRTVRPGGRGKQVPRCVLTVVEGVDAERDKCGYTILKFAIEHI